MMLQVDPSRLRSYTFHGHVFLMNGLDMDIIESLLRNDSSSIVSVNNPLHEI